MWTKQTVIPMMIVLLGAAFALGVYVGESQIPAVQKVTGLLNKEGDPLALTLNAGEEEIDFAPYWRVWNVLNAKFVPRSTSTDAQIDPQDKVWSSIEGLVDTYHDPYTVFFKPAETEVFKESTLGSFEGIGMVIGIDKQDRLVAVAPLEDSPAMQAGLQAGDIIMKIDGEESVSWSTDIAVEKIRGPKRTTVVLTVKREGEDDLLDFTVTRGKIDIPSTSTGTISREVKKPKEGVETTKVVTNPDTGEEEVVPIPIEELPEEALEVVEQDFFVLQLFSFSESSMRAFKKGLEEFANSGTNKLVIDLRGNPGGYLESAVDMASYFIPAGDVVVREIVGADQSERVHRSKGHDLLANTEDIKLVVLVNRGSASASEILAGALQEYGLATLIGEKTFGKGSVQELIDITGDVSLKVTIARWFTPNGVSISEHGLTPDIVLDLTDVQLGTDPTFDAAVEYLTTDEKE